MTHPLNQLASSYHSGKPIGITSVCSAHPLVIEAALQFARDTNQYVLIEATCNQVNQDGGYTGMTPQDFRNLVESIANKLNFQSEKIILGGDHLGPNPWKNLPPKEAMNKAEAMITAYTKAGFTKLHLDTSMGCAGESVALTDKLTSQRAARLALIAEKHTSGQPPFYIIGTEVPVPGGATHTLDYLEPTSPDAAYKTYEIHKQSFEELGLHDAFSRVIGLVVQPGVEFGHSDVIEFDEEKSQNLSNSLSKLPNIIFEAHSTDYQSQEALNALVKNGFGILKVGPWLTFALREALYRLDSIADIMDGQEPKGRLMAKMEEIMLSSPDNWKKYYFGDEQELWIQRHFSLSDRIRYYWPNKTAQLAVEKISHRLKDKEIPIPVLSQFMSSYSTQAKDNNYHNLLIRAIVDVLTQYDRAIK